MNYIFPRIEHINDVLPAIEGSKEFIIAKKENYTVINYAVSKEDTFPIVNDLYSAIRRECRGLIFDNNGKLINRRYHKFFNVDEREETLSHSIDWSKPHHILDKLDGSMVSPCMISGEIRWLTKMGVTHITPEVEKFVSERNNYKVFAEEMLRMNATPIFEWCSDKNRIVIEFPQDWLVLTAVRSNETGEYSSVQDLKDLESVYHIPVINSWAAQKMSHQELINTIRSVENTEGIVVRFDDGHMLKIKTEWYVLRHKAKDSIGMERNIMNFIINETIDDIKPFLSEEDRKKIDLHTELVWYNIKQYSTKLALDFVSYIMQCDYDRKSFAIDIVSKLPKIEQPIMFNIFDGKDPLDLIIETIKKNLGNNKNMESVRPLWSSEDKLLYWRGENNEV